MHVSKNCMEQPGQADVPSQNVLNPKNGRKNETKVEEGPRQSCGNAERKQKERARSYAGGHASEENTHKTIKLT